MRSTWRLPLCLLLGLAVGFQGPGKDKKGKEKPPEKGKDKPALVLRPFLGKLAEAKLAAQERNAALLVHIVLEGEEANDRYRDTVLTDPELIAACERAVVLVSNNGNHERKQVEVVVEGKSERREVCALYPWFESCAQHSQTFNDLAMEFREEGGDLICPQTVVILPDGKTGWRHNVGDTPKPSEVLAGLQEAQAKFGPGLLEAELTEVRRTLAEARAAMEARSFPLARRKWMRIRELTPLSPYGKQADAALPLVEKGLLEELDALCTGLVPGQAAAAWQKLADYQKECAGLAVEKEIAARLKKAEADKAIQAEIAAAKLELEADTLLRQAQELADQKKEKELAKVLKKLFAKRLESTAAAAKARALWPDAG